MSTVLLHVSMSLDGCVAGPGVGVDLPMGAGGERLHDWLFSPARGAADRQVEEEMKAAAGAVVIGRRTFDVGIGPWGDVPHPAPCFVLTHRIREPLAQRSGSFTFVDGGIADAVDRARQAARGGSVLLMGAEIAGQALTAGLVDEVHLQLVPILLGGGARLFDGVVPEAAGFELTRSLASPLVVHLRYRVAHRR